MQALELGVGSWGLSCMVLILARVQELKISGESLVRGVWSWLTIYGRAFMEG